MNKRLFISSMVFIFIIEIAMLVIFVLQKAENSQDAVAVNEVVHSVQENWHAIGQYKDRTGLEYTVLDNKGQVLYRSRDGISESINQAVLNRDTILDIKIKEKISGKIIIYNESAQEIQVWKQKAVIIIISAITVQFILCALYFIYIKRTIISPFSNLKDFARRIAGGNLDVPLEMDRQNIFGAFTESFDIMRSELKRAQLAEAEANASKKELVAKLSHDIKTPVASIKAVSELGAALADRDRDKENYTNIINKAGQIDALVTNLFTATLDELKQLSVVPSVIESKELKEMLQCSDYFGYASVPEVPVCLLQADRLRLQQVFDNIFANSYKYADTKINVHFLSASKNFKIIIEDYGGGIKEEELPLIKEKFRRGSNSEGIGGAGLGLFISDYFMKEMGGGLVVENWENGLKVTVRIPLA
ncbi:MAG: HAMP domain-containing histidine kinase [Lachnospiraceae bacterium]|nr:HAMP domain-containing histidine kinase [Lachnospiraceae bacterium]